MSKKTLSLFSGERAVSPVIGVALMIGIVVVLAGTIGFAVLDFGDDVGAEPQASVDVEQTDTNTYRVTWISEGNSDYITFAGHDAVNAGSPASGDIHVNGVEPDLSANVTAADSVPGIAEAGQSFTVEYGDSSTSGQVTISAAIAQNPEDTTTVVDSVDN